MCELTGALSGCEAVRVGMYPCERVGVMVDCIVYEPRFIQQSLSRLTSHLSVHFDTPDT